MNREPLTAEQRRLFDENVRLAERAAFRRAPSILPAEDRRQEALIGLVEAARRFDPSRGVKFSTYASQVIARRIVDAERLPGSRLLNLSRRDQSGGRAPINVASASTVVADEFGRPATLGDVVFVAPDEPNGVDDRDEVEAAMRCLDERERRVVTMYFLKAFTMKRAAEAVGVSEGRVSQIIADAVDRLGRQSALSHYARGA